MTIAENLKRLRAARGWSQDRLATLAGMTQSRVRAIEIGETANPRTDTVAKLAQALGVTAAELVGDAGGGMAEAEAAPWAGLEARDLVFRLSPSARHPTAYRVASDMAAFGMMAGDVAVIDLNGVAAAGDVVVATIADPETGAARTVVRRYLPPVLVDSAARDALRADGNAVAIMGPVVAVFRSRDFD